MASGRRAYGLEIDPRYVDVALRRWAEITREVPIYSETGSTLEEVAADRGIPLGDFSEATDV